jgi:hypothetical protein
VDAAHWVEMGIALLTVGGGLIGFVFKHQRHDDERFEDVAVERGKDRERIAKLEAKQEDCEK